MEDKNYCSLCGAQYAGQPAEHASGCFKGAAGPLEPAADAQDFGDGVQSDGAPKGSKGAGMSSG